MLIPIRKTVQLSGGAVTLRAWPVRVADANLLDLLTLSATLGHLREEWPAYRREDVTDNVWGSFWRLVQASLESGAELPRPTSWLDRLTLLEAMFELNDVEEAESKMQSLTSRAQRLLNRTREMSGQITA